ncbi:hypothetical protein [Kocuria sp. ZOR0020]|uniref:hypothetical protein n=1 Tax=Kocuria sp. ZOR0020 TaxID=1339234 RepID=UPI0006475AA2|nr:hypothetical protein [Kocuria sp. ZOR0020]
MVREKKTPTSYTLGVVLLYVPVALGLLVVFDILASTTWMQITTTVVIIACVGIGSYLAWWGKRPRQARGEWIPSKTLPKDDDAE